MMKGMVSVSVQAVALCQFLENNQQSVSLMDKAVLELGAGTGLLSIVASLLGKSPGFVCWVGLLGKSAAGSTPGRYVCLFEWIGRCLSLVGLL